MSKPGERDRTHVVNKNLAATSASTRWTAKASASATTIPTTTSSTLVATTPTTGRASEARFGFAILQDALARVPFETSINLEHRKGGVYLANVNKSTHQVLVAESVDGVLCLISTSIFNDSKTVSRHVQCRIQERLTRIPKRSKDEDPMRQSNVQP
jgi:hypothetical protein